MCIQSRSRRMAANHVYHFRISLAYAVSQSVASIYFDNARPTDVERADAAWDATGRYSKIDSHRAVVVIYFGHTLIDGT